MPELNAVGSQAGSSGGHVLLVDDDPQVLNAYGRILRTAGMSVVQVSEGAQIVELLAASPFDAVISDIRLQGSSGIGVLRAVRAFDPDLPVVLITAGGDLTSAVDAVTHGALRYLLKPVPPALLRDTVRDAVRLRRLAVTQRRAFELYGSAAVKETLNVDLTGRFDRALETLWMAYQPIVRWSDRSVFAYEALVRNDEPSLRAPDALLAAAEKLGRLFDVGRAVRRSVAAMIAITSQSPAPRSRRRTPRPDDGVGGRRGRPSRRRAHPHAPYYARRMPSTARLAASIPHEVRDLAKRLQEGGFRSWVVGGCVRDELLAERRGLPTDGRNDWDIATSARPEDVTTLFRRVIPTGVQHGTVTVLMKEGQYEVTTLRGETTYTDGRRPDSVYFVDDIKDDLARRDFTINAIAYDPLADKVIDPFDGQKDLEQGVLRAVGDPAARFAEDGLRVLRAARFVATLEVALEPATERAIEPSLASYKKVSAERVRDEWVKAMKARAPSRAFRVMERHGLLAISAPELLESVGCAQNKYHAYDVWEHALACLDGCPANPVLRVAGLLHDVGKPRSREFSEKHQDYTFYEHDRIGAEMVGPLLSRLRFSNDERERIVALVRHHILCYDETWSDAAVRRWLKRVGPELAGDLYALGRADGLAKGRDATLDLKRIVDLETHAGRVLAAGAVFGIKDLAIDGHLLMKELGVPPGRKIGELLRALLEEVVETPAKNEREALLARARTLLQSGHF